ncbi:OB-fold nucleic acid binding domain-containing protein [Parafrankia sp. FMc2]|uniref:helix-hairpin-helix domain-containing protein n=1 Tax=Parafrankia sp. FMc2 TaxID=3233196 RepID=UPI003B586BF2
MIEQLGFPGYFLIVHDIVEFCRNNNILCQGRGSAANSAVCYALGITNVDAVSFGLLFERFLAPERGGPPDIDVDIESGRREEVIQYVYGSYGRYRAAQVANVITYRPWSAVRDVARALGYSPGQQDAWSRQIERRIPPPAGPAGAAGNRAGSGTDPDPGTTDPEASGGQEWAAGGGRAAGGRRAAGRGIATDPSAGIPAEVLDLAHQLLGFPRHLGIHSAGLVKFDLLGLGMLSMLHGAFDLVRDHHGRDLDLGSIPPEDPAVYDMLCAADSIGVFQVESRAQMSTLPRLRPRRFYDLVVEVALIRPGPIQGGSVHPYIRRRNGAEGVVYPHPLLRRSLEKTLGVPLFQEQFMQMAIDVADFTPAEADQLRRAMGAKRATERIDRLRARLYAGMAANGIVGAAADDLYAKLAAFANFGFPESHSVSFAFLVYASSWIKLYYPAVFCAALLNAQPMGFYSPQSLVADARRHGIVVHGPDLDLSAVGARLTGSPAAVRLGLAGVRRLGDAPAGRIVAERDAHGPYQDISDLVRRVGLRAEQIEALATAGAFNGFGLARREALWAAGAVTQTRPDRLEGMVFGADVSAVAALLPGMNEAETVVADLWATGTTPGCYPTEIVRDLLDELGVVVARRLRDLESGRRVLVAGVVTHRQCPSTAGGTTFMSLEDETGLANVICSRGVWARYRSTARSAAALIVRGRLESAQGVVNAIAASLRVLPLAVGARSRDFR